MASKRGVMLVGRALQPARILRPAALARVHSPVCRSTPLRPTPCIAASPISLAQQKRWSSSSQEPLRSPLYDLHASHGAKFVPFGGYAMPVYYSDLSIGESHKWTREKASIFDVSHMVQHKFTGPKVVDFLQTITPSSISALAPFTSTLSALLKRDNRRGGIVDDTVITRWGDDDFYIVTNAGCRDGDGAYFAAELDTFRKTHNVAPNWHIMEGQGLIAMQGPLAASILEESLVDADKGKLKDLYFGSSRYLALKLADGSESSLLHVARAGYTGEDGFEISIPGPETTAVTGALLKTAGPDQLRLAGLGARDSLRLEAGMCLYGHDLNEGVTPPEGGLAWIVGKDRRGETDESKGAFIGADIINAQILGKNKGGIAIERRRVGLVIEGGIAREGATIHDLEGNQIGEVTSGCPSPTLNKNIAMGYIKSGQHKSGTEVQVKIRKNLRKATVTKMPFITPQYYKG